MSEDRETLIKVVFLEAWGFIGILYGLRGGGLVADKAWSNGGVAHQLIIVLGVIFVAISLGYGGLYLLVSEWYKESNGSSTH